MAIVYSYIRFSTKAQADGTSLKRQRELGDAWIKENKHTLANVPLEDLGVSAFRGKNKHLGKLAEFLGLAKSGCIAPDSILLVEALDRLSRQGIDEAMTLFKDILRTGVSIAVIKPYPIVYTRESLNDLTGMLIPMITFYLAALESENKSFRQSAVHKFRRENATKQIIDTKKPAWIDFVDGKFKLNKGAKAVEHIFERVAEGAGVPTIARELNKKFPPIGKSKNGWTLSYISKILQSTIAIGERTHCKIVNGKRIPEAKTPSYYPAAVSEELFNQAMAKKAPKAKAGRTSATINLFKGLVINAKTHYPMHLHCKKMNRLVDYGHTKGLPDADSISVDYDKFETVFIKYLSELSPMDLMEKRTKNAFADKEQELSGVQQRLDETQAILIDAPSKLLAKVAQELETKLERLTVELATLKAQSTPLPVDDIKKLSDLSNPDTRLKLQTLLSRIVKNIWIKSEKYNRTVYSAVLIEFRNGQFRNLLINPVGGTKLQASKPDEYCSIDLRNKELCRNTNLFDKLARLVA